MQVYEQCGTQRREVVLVTGNEPQRFGMALEMQAGGGHDHTEEDLLERGPTEVWCGDLVESGFSDATVTRPIR